MLSKPPHKSLKAIDNLRFHTAIFKMVSYDQLTQLPDHGIIADAQLAPSPQDSQCGWRKRCTIIAPNKVKVSRQHVCRRGPLAACACVSLLLVFAFPGTNNLQIWRIIIPPVPTDSYAALNVTTGMIGGAHPIYGRITIRGSLQQNNQNHICYNWVY